MKKPKFEVGEWCFCEFELQRVKSTEDDRINGVTTGIIEMGGYDLSDRCFPISIEIKRVSDSVAYWSRQFHAIKHNGLNHPDLNRALVDRWVELCKNINNQKKLQVLYDELDAFGTKVRSAAANLRLMEVSGIPLFR
jgi:hypothetical protein